MQGLLVCKYFYETSDAPRNADKKFEEMLFLDDSFQDKFIGHFQKLTFQSCFNHCIKKFLTTRLTNMGFCSPEN